MLQFTCPKVVKMPCWLIFFGWVCHSGFLKVTPEEEKPWLFDVDSSSISIYKSFARKALQRSGTWSNVDMGERFLWGYGDDTWRNEIKQYKTCILLHPLDTGIFWILSRKTRWGIIWGPIPLWMVFLLCFVLKGEVCNAQEGQWVNR